MKGFSVLAKIFGVAHKLPHGLKSSMCLLWNNVPCSLQTSNRRSANGRYDGSERGEVIETPTFLDIKR